jgi:hypothetical protein
MTPPWRTPARGALALALAACLLTLGLAGVPTWEQALLQFSPDADLPSQRAALDTLLAAVGRTSRLPLAGAVIGSPGIRPWGAPNTSYCTWWGVNCCGSTLTTSLALCEAGPNSVSGLHIVAVNLTGQLPNVFGDLPDLQLFDISFNRGVRGRRGALRGAAAARRPGRPPATSCSRGRSAVRRRLRAPSLPSCPRLQACWARCRRAWGSCATCGCWTSPAPA